MKSIILFMWLLLLVSNGFSQNTLPANGNVGIGTSTPGSPLTVSGDVRATGVIGGYGMHANVLKIPPLDAAPAYFYISTNIPANSNAAPQIHITGYMYGAQNKAMKITIGWYYYQGNFYWSQWQSELGYQKPSRIRLGTYIKNGSPFIRIEVSNNSVYWSNYSVSATDYSDHTYNYYSGWTFAEGEVPENSTSQIHTVIQNASVVIDGNLGLGVSSPTEKLAVNGNIRAKEIKVENNNWPDYVFAKDYQLPSLQETEKHIQDNGTLPGIPSASEVKANGVSLGEMNAKLLQKIEELTLHLIEKDKEIKSIKSDYQELREMVVETRYRKDKL